MPRIVGFTRVAVLCLLGLLLVATPEMALAGSSAQDAVASSTAKKKGKSSSKAKKSAKKSSSKGSKSAKSSKKGSKSKASKSSKSAKASKSKASKSSKSAKASKSKASKSSKSAKASKKRGSRSGKVEKVTYKVKRGDNLTKIARKFNTDVKTLRKLNRMKPGGLKAGKAIVVRISKAGSGPRRLQEGVSLPESGPGYIAPRRDRTWGTRGTVEHIQEAAAAVARQYPGTVPVFIGDVSFHNGGFMPPHKSHRGGRDVDVGYFAKNNEAMTYFVGMTPKTLDAEKTWAYFDALLSTGHLSAIYVDRWLHKPLREAALKMGYDEETVQRLFETRGYGDGASRKAVIRHIRGHRDHFHVRFDCPKGEHPSS